MLVHRASNVEGCPMDPNAGGSSARSECAPRPLMELP